MSLPRSGERCNATPTHDQAHARHLDQGRAPGASTSAPMTVAVAGSSDTISAYVDRASRAMASWSHT